MAPCSKAAFADWWKSTTATSSPIDTLALDHRRFWDAMHAVTAQQLEQINDGARLCKVIEVSGVDVLTSVALDMTNFATFITTANAKAPTQRRARRSGSGDLRLVGLGLVVAERGERSR